MRVATCNVWGLPWPFAREIDARAQAIGEALAGMSLDLWCFQEVWTPAMRRGLIDAGRRAGLAHVWHNPDAFGGSGLLVLSRAPIRDARFEVFALRGFPQRVWQADYHGDKGFCLLHVAAADGDFALVDTHLLAQYESDERDDGHGHRIGQISQLAAAIAQERAPLLAVGDFNVREDRPEYAIFAGATGARDAAVELSRREPTTLASNAYRRRRDATSEERIDYVFTRDGDGRRLRARSLLRIFDTPPERGPAAYSDHAGLVAELELTNDPTSHAPTPDAGALALAEDELAAGRELALARRGSQRLTAAAGVGAAALAVLGARRPRLSRRRLLRAGLGTGALLALPFGISNAALSELASPGEIEGFDAVAARLAGLRGAVASR